MTQTFARALAGSDLRSIGRANEVARALAHDPGRTAETIALLESGDPVLRARSADALEKASRALPGMLQRQKRALLRVAARATQQEVRWHLAQMLPRLRLTLRERRQAMRQLRRYLGDESRIVQVCAMQSLWELDPGAARGLVERMAATGSPALRARARRLLRRAARPASRPRR